MQDYKPDNRKIVHMHPYHYSLIHHSLGVPLSSMQPPLYHLDPEYANDSAGGRGPLTGEGGVLGTKFNQSERKQQGNDSLVTDSLLLRLTECEQLSEIRVISLRN